MANSYLQKKNGKNVITESHNMEGVRTGKSSSPLNPSLELSSEGSRKGKASIDEPLKFLGQSINLKGDTSPMGLDPKLANNRPIFLRPNSEPKDP